MLSRLQLIHIIAKLLDVRINHKKDLNKRKQTHNNNNTTTTTTTRERGRNGPVDEMHIFKNNIKNYQIALVVV